MPKSLDQRLEAARGTLDKVDALLTRHSAALNATALEQFRRSLVAGNAIDFWRDLLAARDAARTWLDGLEGRADMDDLVEHGAKRIKFSHVRLIGVEAYLSTAWSLADSVSAFVGRVLCTSNGGAFNDQGSAKLVSHFVQTEKTKETTAGIVFDSVRQTFGWPIGISYAIRNHFIHDGGLQKEIEFFDGRSAAASFRIHPKAWQMIERKAYSYSVQREFSRSAGWPDAPCDDLRAVLLACERETDDALGVLVASACNALAFHVSVIAGQD